MKWALGGCFVACQLTAAICNAATPSAQFPDAESPPATQPVTVPTPASPSSVAPAGPALGPAPPAPVAAEPLPASAARPAAPGYPLPPPVDATKPPDDSQILSLTFSPIHLILPIFEVTAEFRVVPHFGISVIGGYGKITETTVGEFDTEQLKLTAYELGGQLVGYPLHSFQSLQLGAEVLWLKVDLGNVNAGNVQVSGAGNGVAVGPLIGYKLMSRAGFTFFVQGGFEYIAARAHANDTAGNTSSASQTQFIPLLNANIGWSF